MLRWLLRKLAWIGLWAFILFFAGLLAFNFIAGQLAPKLPSPVDCTKFCAVPKYTCADQRRVAVRADILNNTGNPKEVTVYIATTNKFGTTEGTTPVTIPAHSQRHIMEIKGLPGETYTFRIESDGKTLTEGKLGSADPCYDGDIPTR